MHVFNTGIVRDIVNLYNWKGPEGFKINKNDKRVVEVDKIAKSTVNECVHDFLLILCTSHKYGVIFKDPLVGLGKRNQNALMYTVLNSLERPWEHSYASELVIGICQSCPDLVKHVWTLLSPFLEPRPTEKWYKAVNFLKKLLEIIEPKCIDYCARSLKAFQLAQLIEILTSPIPVLKVLLSDNSTENTLLLDIYTVVSLMIQKVNNFASALESWTNSANIKTIKDILATFIARNFPSVQKMLNIWKTITSKDNLSIKLDYLEVVLRILKCYQTLAPTLMYDLTSANFEITDFFLCDEEHDERQKHLQIKVIDIFVDIDPSYFLPTNNLFSKAISVLLPFYHLNKQESALMVLRKLLKNCDIFESCLHEVDVWINGIFNCKSILPCFIDQFVEVLQDASVNMLTYQDQMSHIEISEIGTGNFFGITEDSEDIIYNTKHSNFSVLIVSFLKSIQDKDISKSIKKYLEFVIISVFHQQTVPDRFLKVIQIYESVIPSYILEYIQSWCTGSCDPLMKFKGCMDILKTFSENFLTTTLKEDIFVDMLYPGYYLDILKVATFYFTNLVRFDCIDETKLNNWLNSVQLLHKKDCFNLEYQEVVLVNNNLVNNFDIKQVQKKSTIGHCTRAIFKIAELIRPAEKLTAIYSQSIFNSVIKSLKKHKKINFGDCITDYLKVFPLNCHYCYKIIEYVIDVMDSTEDSILNILSYSIGRISELCKINHDYSPIQNDFINRVTDYMATALDLGKDCSSLCSSLKNYFQTFPFSIAYIHKNVFPNLLLLKEYHKDSAELAVFLLERNLGFASYIKEHLVTISEKKGVILPLTHILIRSNMSEDILKDIYGNLEGSFIKALQKPQKVGQHFLKDYDVHKLIGRFMPVDKCKLFIDKVQRFEVTEIFHVKFFEALINRLMSENELNDKQISNIILTFVHMEMMLFKKKTPEDDQNIKISQVAEIFNRVLEKITSNTDVNIKHIFANDTFNTFCKFVLKYGVSGQYDLLQILTTITNNQASTIEKEQASFLLEMLLSHSEFLNIMLGEHNATKFAVLNLLSAILENWNELMERTHVPLLLAAYRGMVSRCDRLILKLLKLYESNASQTSFYDFKPFLWGRLAATHYSVRNNIESSLTRQPKMSQILGNLKYELVNNTITNYPFKESLQQDEVNIIDSKCYDLKFLLPLFSHILAPEQQVKTYLFTRTGALSLTVIALSSVDKEVRQAACHVLSRFHFHLEARQTGKDNMLWIRFIEAICKGVVALPNFKLNNFAAIFFARMALILTNPKLPMYTPLCSYLSAKQHLNISTVPELYTLLFSSDVNYKEHRHFILGILKDGLRNEKDFLDLLKSMGLKMFLELFASCVSDSRTRHLILDVLLSACTIPLGVKMLCENYSLLAFLYNLVAYHKTYSNEIGILPKVLKIFLEIVKVRQDHYTSKFIFDLFLDIAKSETFKNFNENDLNCFYHVLYKVFSCCPEIVSGKDTILNILLDRCDDSFVKYLRTYGCNFVDTALPEFQSQDKYMYLRLLIYSMLK
ncbi:nucleolar pre-ribosomal-associated protein 1 isoform X2 [Rhynchophorus ferrugineus]